MPGKWSKDGHAQPLIVNSTSTILIVVVRIGSNIHCTHCTPDGVRSKKSRVRNIYMVWFQTPITKIVRNADILRTGINPDMNARSCNELQ